MSDLRAKLNEFIIADMSETIGEALNSFVVFVERHPDAVDEIYMQIDRRMLPEMQAAQAFLILVRDASPPEQLAIARWLVSRLESDLDEWKSS